MSEKVTKLIIKNHVITKITLADFPLKTLCRAVQVGFSEMIAAHTYVLFLFLSNAESF